jgi:hypothetical protein
MTMSSLLMTIPCVVIPPPPAPISPSVTKIVDIAVVAIVSIAANIEIVRIHVPRVHEDDDDEEDGGAAVVDDESNQQQHVVEKWTTNCVNVDGTNGIGWNHPPFSMNCDELTMFSNCINSHANKIATTSTTLIIPVTSFSSRRAF